MWLRFQHGVDTASILSSVPVYYFNASLSAAYEGAMEANISSFSDIRTVESVYAANPHKWKCSDLYKKHCGTL